MSPRARLARAYARTLYVVDSGDEQLILRVHRPAVEQQRRLCAQHGLRGGWAIITAVNPGSRPLPHAVNSRRMRRLQHLLRAQKLKWLPACNRARHGPWPDEPAYLVIDPPRGRMKLLARRFGQYAIVTGVRERPPRLCFVR